MAATLLILMISKINSNQIQGKTLPRKSPVVKIVHLYILQLTL